ncbi:hypothetical protein FOXB_12218 [Fusarium oxysporum f. sp. conglutinans Fo5176]|uniref:Uncharacterized protein n=5 Tax=Fusarium oxysporum TaxID=5507 RepID=F9G0N6_FUSOF|nr:hypothetical protein FOXB_12218 [Fusarium oxysporum f. sp. conglutinans Fo5176]
MFIRRFMIRFTTEPTGLACELVGGSLSDWELEYGQSDHWIQKRTYTRNILHNTTIRENLGAPCPELSPATTMNNPAIRTLETPQPGRSLPDGFSRDAGAGFMLGSLGGVIGFAISYCIVCFIMSVVRARRQRNRRQTAIE